MDKGEGEVSRFPSKVFCLTVPKKALGEPFILSLNSSGIEEVWMRGWGGGCRDFPSKPSCLTVPEDFVGQPFRVSLISGIENFMHQSVISRCFVDFVCVTKPQKS